jgi:hypothetical protein
VIARNITGGLAASFEGPIRLVGHRSLPITDLQSVTGDPNAGGIFVTHAASAAAGRYRASLAIDPSNGNQGRLFAEVKSFLVANPNQPDTDIAYAVSRVPKRPLMFEGQLNYLTVKPSFHFRNTSYLLQAPRA